MLEIFVSYERHKKSKARWALIVHLSVAMVSMGCITPASAYTTSTCDEKWFVPTPGKEFDGTSGIDDGSVGAFTLSKEKDRCDKHRVEMLGWFDYQSTEGFAMVDGKGYFIKKYQAVLSAFCGTNGGSMGSAECFLPSALRHKQIQYHNKYYQVTEGARLTLFPLAKRDLERLRRTDKQAWDPASYATDGHWVFFVTQASDNQSLAGGETVLRIKDAGWKVTCP